MLATVFIPTGNRARSLRTVLDSLTRQTYKDFEVIVVDYRSTDKTPETITHYAKKLRITVINQKEKGLARAANLALKAARGDIFIRTDDDVKMSPGWLRAIVDTFKTNKKVGGVTGPTVIPASIRKNRDLFANEELFRNGPIYWNLIGKLYFDFFTEGQTRRVSHWFASGAFSLGSNFDEALQEPMQEVTNLEACNMAVRTSVLRKIGGFDTRYGGVGDYHEPDAAFRITYLGYKLIFNPKAALNHLPSQEGLYAERPASFSRMENFVVFYLRHIKPNTFNKGVRFLLYACFLNCYYIFTAIQLRQPKQLGALIGTLAGVIKYFKTKNNGLSA